ncbi:MAG TPA: hypothetical protein DCZ59_09950 [Bacteroidetes bacterium]|nr:hypothetical protein [Bacteroidota bacterium]
MTDLYRSVMSASAAECGVDVTKCLVSGKLRDVVRARHIAWYILHTHFGWSPMTISRNAKFFSDITIRYGIGRVGDMPATSSVGDIVERVLSRVH